MSKTPALLCDNGDTIELPWKWSICCACNGHGRSSAYLGAFTQSDREEAGPEFMEDYMNGAYDRACEDCGGTGKVKVADYSRLTKEQRRELRAQARADAEYRTEVAHERRQLGGW